MPGFFTGSNVWTARKRCPYVCLPKGFYATPSRRICKACLAVARAAGFKTAGMRLLLAVSERRFMEFLSPRNNGGRERPQQQRLGNVALHCLLCSVSARLILCPHPSLPAASRRTQPNTRSGCPSWEHERAEALLHVHRPRRRVRRARAFLRRKIPLS